MTDSLETLKTQHQNTLALLQRLTEFLKTGAAFGLRVDTTLNRKIEKALRNAQDGKLTIALIGGFSEGKTSIAAAWLGRLETGSMRISQEESSDAVSLYDIDGDMVLVDTPGLFGYKEKFGEESRKIEAYKDITRRYVSEAHLVLYVMDPTNPVKDSHREELNWLFRTLNLLPRTVFVLSRFDEVADVEDEDEYKENLDIKRSNVASRLRQLIGLTDEEASTLSIVGVAANPFDKGVGYWLSRPEQFRALSHIGQLQAAAVAKIDVTGGHQGVIDEARRSIIRDVLAKQLPVMAENDRSIAQELHKLSDMDERLSRQLSQLNRRIQEARSDLREFVATFFADLILQADGVDESTFKEFYEREIGNEGVVLNARLQNGFSRQIDSVALELDSLAVSVESEVNHFNETVTNLGKQGIQYVIESSLINNRTVLAARDGIVSTAKLFGKDLGKLLKFKPWGAVKLASRLNLAAATLGVLVEGWEAYQGYSKAEKFASAIKEMVGDFENQRRSLIEMTNSADFSSQFFPEYDVLQSNLQGIAAEVITLQERRKHFKAWCQEGEIIDAEFSVLPETLRLA
jgi:GTP-binding protein EngB required for normal cell division